VRLNKASAFRRQTILLLGVLSFISCDTNTLTHQAQSSSKTPQPSRFEPEPASAPVSTDPVSAGPVATDPVSTGKVTTQKTLLATDYVAVTANPHATRAAHTVLREGGSAIDAAIAAQMVLGLVEPQSSGLGGGGFLVYWDNKQKQLVTYDGRETAPSAADETLFLEENSDPMSFFKAIVGGRSVGAPGLVRMLEDAHKDYGKKEWSQLFGEAITLAENGFSVSPRLHQLIAKVPAVNARPEIASYLFDENGNPLAEGATIKNTLYAKALKSIAFEGSVGFYEGKNAQLFIDAVGGDSNPGQLSLRDLKNYQAKNREAVCAQAFGHNICGMGMPSSGPTTVMMTLKIMEGLLSDKDLTSFETVTKSATLSHSFIEASRLAFADRNTYLADSDFVDVPVKALLNTNYLNDRAALIENNKMLEQVSQGEPSAGLKAAWLHQPSLELASTTHLSIVDNAGNMVSMTTSIETAFGSRLMAGGYILNNQLTDFSFAPETADKKKVAKRVQANKRPLSSMSPIIVFDSDDQPVLVIGSPGGKSIIPYVAKTLFEVLALNRDLEESVNDTHIVHTGRALVLEEGTPQSLIEDLQLKGHAPKIKAQASGIHAIQRVNNKWLGVADKRREGTAAGR